MIIAHQKKKENIAEYIIYMWHIEDLIRAYGLDLEKIETGVVERFDVEPDVKKQMKEWYAGLISMMVEEKIEKKGHLGILRNIVNDMNELHMDLLQSRSQMAYNVMFFNVVPVLSDFRARSGAGADVNDVELGLNLMYEILLLRLQQKPVSAGTEAAVAQVSKFLAVLSAKYKEDDEGELKL